LAVSTVVKKVETMVAMKVEWWVEMLVRCWVVKTAALKVYLMVEKKAGLMVA